MLGSICWGSSIRDSKKLNKLIKKAGSVLGTALETILKRRMLHKLVNIKNNTDHPLHNIVLQEWSVFSLRLLQLYCNTVTGDPSCQQQ